MNRRFSLLIALSLVALMAAGCSDETSGDGAADTGDRFEKAVEFSECMRDSGVREFPDPDASGELTIDGVLNGSSLDPEGQAWKSAVSACEDLQPPGFTGDHEVSAEERDTRLEFAECMRENGVEDFPDPADDEPLVNTNLIPSSATEGGMTILDAAMEACGDYVAEALRGE